jgi:DNA-binding CsgD family transcriptional regulator
LQSLWWKAHGLAYKEIAKKIGIGELTVKSHLRRAYARLGSHDGAHAIATCFRMGIFPPSGYVVLTIEEMASIARRRGG